MGEKRKTVFISYSWDSTEHQQWVLNLAKDLIEKYGIDVILDEYDLKAGSDLPHFMEQAIEKADKVLIILTPNYKTRAEERKSGAGYETTMIAQELFESDITNIKFLPILREGNAKSSSPKFLKSKLYLNMVDESVYFSELLKLAKQIYEQPVTVKPVLGPIPNFDEPAIDPIIDGAKALIHERNLNKELDQIIGSNGGVAIFNQEMEAINAQLQAKAELYKAATGLNFVYQTDGSSTTYIGCENITLIFEWDSKYVNTAKEAFLEERRVNGLIRMDNSAASFRNKQPQLLRRTNYNFDLNYSKNVVWRVDGLKFSSAEIAENAFIFLLGEVKQEISRDFRR